LISFTAAAGAAEIHDAARAGDLAKVEFLLKRNPGLLEIADKRGCTPLHFACDGGHCELAALLIDRGADIHVRDVDGDTPLHWAAVAGRAEAAKLLISKGADVDARNMESATPLHYSILRGHKNLAELLIENGAAIDAQNYDGHAPLHWAVLRNQNVIVHLLLQKGADMEIRNSYGRTPLLLAARETGSAYIARMLASKGADIDARDKFGSTSLDLAAWRGFEGVVNLLLDLDAAFDARGREGPGLLTNAAGRNLERLFSLLAERGADLEIENGKGGSLLHSAAEGGATGIATILLDSGADINEADRYGWTPLHYAAHRGRMETAELLVDEGAALDARTFSGRTPFNLAEARDHIAVAQFLAERGAVQEPVRFPVLSGEYMGQERPGPEPAVFALDIVSSHDGEHGCITFSADGREAYWATSFVISDTGYSSGGILSSRIDNDRWTEPEFAFFTRGLKTKDDVPFCSPDGGRIYFVSRRPTAPGTSTGKENIWYIEKRSGEWSTPIPVSKAVNFLDVHWQISVSRALSLYFCCSEKGLCCSRWENGGYTEPVPVGNPAGDDFSGDTPFIAPDESYLIFNSFREGGHGGSDLYIAFRDRDGEWTKPVNMGPGVNSPAGERCPILSPDGRYLFFLSTRNGKSNVWWVDAGVIDGLRKVALR
jgi:ankyrin repeat protein